MPPNPAGFDSTVPLSRVLAAVALAKALPKTIPVDRARRAASRAEAAKSSRPKPSSSKQRDGGHWIGPAMLWGGAAVLLVAAAGWWWSGRSEEPAPLAADETVVQAEATPSAPGLAAPPLTAAATRPAATRTDKPAVQQADKAQSREAPNQAPVRDLSTPATSEPRPIPVTRPPVSGDASAPTTVTGAADPRAACGKKVFLAMTLCIDRLCRKPAYAGAEECVKLRDLRDQREQQRH
jgi:non-specific serine/threonine protein kinase